MRFQRLRALIWIFWFAQFASAQRPSNRAQELGNLYSDATQAYGRQEFQTAADLARRMISLCPQCKSIRLVLAASLTALNQLQEAKSAAEAEVELDPTNASAHKCLGTVYLMQQHYEEAIDQFRKAIALNPSDYEAHVSLARVLRSQKKCTEAIPELEKALAISSANPSATLVHGECEIDLGNTKDGLDEVERAVEASSSPESWNSAAYELAEHDVALDRAQQWSESSIDVVLALLRNVALEHLTSAQWRVVSLVAAYWDTMGWVHFKRGDSAAASEYLEAAWSLNPAPAIGSHLGQAYEKLSRPTDAIRTYSMTLALMDSLPPSAVLDELVTKTRERLNAIAPGNSNLSDLLKQGRANLDNLNLLTIPNHGHSDGVGRVAVTVAGDKVDASRQLSGDLDSDQFMTQLRDVKFSIPFPKGTPDIPRLGTLTCKRDEASCHLKLQSAKEALEFVLTQTSGTPQHDSPAQSPRSFRDSVIGMTVVLPTDWKFLREETGTYGRLLLSFAKPETNASFFLAHEKVTSSQKLYEKTMTKNWSQHDQFRRKMQTNIVRDGVPGSHWKITWKDKDVEYSGIFEFFTLGSDNYWAVAQAPSRVYGRYEEDLESMMRSIRLPRLEDETQISQDHP